ncbi:MAG: hypothetical protein R2765_02090 [Ferruginibacter sp.]
MKQITIVLSVLFTTFFSKAQNVGIGTTTPLNKLHVAGGLRVDTLANSIDSGLLRHDKNGVVYSLKFTGQSTDVLRGNGTFGNVGQDAWLLYGNSGTDPNTQFIGTTDQTPLRFRIFNTNAGRLDSIGFNTSFGFRTFDSLTTGTYNSALGYKSLISNTTGKYNSAFGEQMCFALILQVGIIPVSETYRFTAIQPEVTIPQLGINLCRITLPVDLILL